MSGAESENVEISTFEVESPRDTKVHCRKCGGRTAHKVLREFREAGDADWIQWREDYRVVQCHGCGTMAFEKTYSDSETFDQKGEPDVTSEVFPNPTARQPMDDHYEMPWHIVRIYEETLRAFSGSMPVLTTMGVRALIEAVCEERGCKPAKLHKQIDELVTLDVIPKHHADLLHEIRFLGNEAAHELAAIQSQELAEAIDAVEVVLRGVYVIPSVTEKMQRQRAKREAKKKK